MRVHVDEPGSDDGAVGVEHAVGRPVHVAERRDAPAAHAEIAAPRRRPGAVGQRPAANEEIVVFGHASSVVG